jgi:hypothetical protein
MISTPYAGRLIPTLSQDILKELILAYYYLLKVGNSWSGTTSAGIRTFAFMVWGQQQCNSAYNYRRNEGSRLLDQSKAPDMSWKAHWEAKYHERMARALNAVRGVDVELAEILQQC